MKKINNLDDLIIFLNKHYNSVFSLDRFTSTNLIIKNETLNINYVIYDYPLHTIVESCYSDNGDTLYLCLINNCMDLLHLIIADYTNHYNINNNFMYPISYQDYEDIEAIYRSI